MGRLAGRQVAGDDGGSVTLEMVLATPVIFLLLSLIVFGGRSVSARGDVVSAAADGARAASIERGLIAAGSAAEQAVAETLTSEGVGCQGEPDVQLSTVAVGGGPPGFEPGNYVQVTVTCDIELSDLSGLGLPGTMEAHHQAAEVIDEHRSEG